MLLHGQADIFARDGNFDTPLHLAAKCGRVEAVKYLMQIADELQTKARAEKLKTLRKRKRKSADGDHETDDHDLFRRRKTYLDRAILNGQRYNNIQH